MSNPASASAWRTLVRARRFRDAGSGLTAAVEAKLRELVASARRGTPNAWETTLPASKTLAMSFTTAADDHSLQGLPGVNVAIHLDEDDALQELNPGDDLTVETLRTDVELQLRLAGIRRLTEDERLVTPPSPALLVTVCFVAASELESVHAFALTVGLYQTVTLASGRQISAETWNRGQVGFAASSRVQALAREEVRERAKAFAHAWRMVNQSTPPLNATALTHQS